jgi:hypothetical protein
MGGKGGWATEDGAGWGEDGAGWVADGAGWVVDGAGWVIDGTGWVADGAGWLAFIRNPRSSPALDLVRLASYAPRRSPILDRFLRAS